MSNSSTNTGYVVGITLVATLGGLLFGYDTAVISGAEQSVQAYLISPLNLSDWIHGATISSALFGCILGGAISGLLALKFGRKKALILAAILFFVSALGSAFPEILFFKEGEPTIGLLLAFNFYRFIGGVGVGLASAVCPMYIGEVAPAGIRGRLVSLNQFAIIFGMLVVYSVNTLIAKGQPLEWINEIGWRRMFLSEAIPAGLFGLLLLLVPETPRYLSLTNRDDDAMDVLTKINGVEKAKQIFTEIKNTLVTHSGNLWSFGTTVIVIGVLLSVFQQFVGINAALYYAPRIFEQMGAGKDASLVQTVVMGLVNVFFTVVAIFTVDRWGRKPLLIIGSLGMAIGMFAIAGLSYAGIGMELEVFAERFGKGTLIFIVIYTASFMVSWGPICWVYISELFPNRIRGRAIAIAVAAQWAANWLVSTSFPALVSWNPVFIYGFYGVMSVLSLLFVLRMVPETKGKTLEEIEEFWKAKG